MPNKKKQVQQATVLSPHPKPKKAAPIVAPVALLIDGENINAPDLIPHILVVAGNLGGVTARQVYGNWSSPSMKSWKKHLASYGLEARGDRPGPNATDIALTIGAMDLLYCGIKHFCLVAGDSDYVPLVQRLRQDGCTVLLIGTSAVSTALKEACSSFLSLDQLGPQKTSKQPAPSSAKSTHKLSALLTQAYRIAAQQSESEWVLLAALGTALRDNSCTFEEIYGSKKLTALLEQFPDRFELRTQQRGNGQVDEVRIRQQFRC